MVEDTPAYEVIAKETEGDGANTHLWTGKSWSSRQRRQTKGTTRCQLFLSIVASDEYHQIRDDEPKYCYDKQHSTSELSSVHFHPLVVE